MSSNQERNNILLNEIRDTIDTKHLGVGTDIWFRGIRGSVSSYYKIVSLSHEQVNEELNSIQSYIPVEDKEYFLKKLQEKHYYVNMLLCFAIDAQFKEIRNNIKGSTLDSFFYPPKHNGFKRMVHARVLDKYFVTHLETRQWLRLTLRSGAKNTHAIVLYGNKEFEIDENSLSISSDSKYLRAVDSGGNEIIWDMEQGKRARLTGWERIHWHYDGYGGHHKYGSKRHVYDYYRARRNTAVLVDAQDISDAATLGIDLGGWKDRAVVLYKTWQKEAEIALVAFERSSTKEELLKLFSSKTVAAIKGFPGESLKEEIQVKISKI